MTGTCLTIKRYEPKNTEEKSPNWSLKPGLTQFSWNKLFIQIISVNRDLIKSVLLSDASLADLYFKSMKTHPKFWEVLRFFNNWFKIPDFDAEKQILFDGASPFIFLGEFPQGFWGEFKKIGR